jgi:hypothetical protein
MKKTIIAAAILAAMGAAHAEDNDFEFVENNVSIEHGPLAYTFRTYFKDDYDHHEIKYAFENGLVGGFRYAEDELGEDNGINGDPAYDISGLDDNEYKQWEYRPWLEYTGLSWQVTDRWSFRARPRIEYRMFDVEDDVVTERDDYARFRAGAWTYYKLTDKVVSWASVDFYNNVSDMEFEQSRYQAGFDYQLNQNISVGPYVETRLDDDWNSRYTMLATQLKVSF